jgi:hypothetical protein
MALAETSASAQQLRQVHGRAAWGFGLPASHHSGEVQHAAARVGKSTVAITTAGGGVAQHGGAGVPTCVAWP